jgi:hypothetical protein
MLNRRAMIEVKLVSNVDFIFEDKVHSIRIPGYQYRDPTVEYLLGLEGFDIKEYNDQMKC